MIFHGGGQLGPSVWALVDSRLPSNFFPFGRSFIATRTIPVGYYRRHTRIARKRMPRRRNSEISRSNRAVVHKKEKHRRKAAACLRRQAVTAPNAPAINPARRAAAVQQGEEIFRAIQAQRPVAPDGPIPPEARAVLVQYSAEVARGPHAARRIQIRREPEDDVLQVANDEELAQ